MNNGMRFERAGIVTGGAGAIGQATAHLLAQAGAQVIVADYTWESAHAAADDLHARYPDRIRCRSADIRQIDDMLDLVQACRDDFGRVDFMIANAGVGDASLLVDGDTERWRTVVETNVLGLAYTVRAVLPIMRDQGHGHIVVVASLSGRVSYVGEAVYAASKWAAVGLGGMLRKEACGYGIRTSIIEPGLVDTPLSRGSALGRQDLEKGQPLVAADVAESIMFALTRPPHVNVTEIVIQPTDEMY
jgi:NADP-dependent 3-hydroxy acid dehydrogenase YdfG